MIWAKPLTSTMNVYNNKQNGQNIDYNTSDTPRAPATTQESEMTREHNRRDTSSATVGCQFSVKQGP